MKIKKLIISVDEDKKINVETGQLANYEIIGLLTDTLNFINQNGQFTNHNSKELVIMADEKGNVRMDAGPFQKYEVIGLLTEVLDYTRYKSNMSNQLPSIKATVKNWIKEMEAEAAAEEIEKLGIKDSLDQKFVEQLEKVKKSLPKLNVTVEKDEESKKWEITLSHPLKRGVMYITVTEKDLDTAYEKACDQLIEIEKRVLAEED